MRQNRRRKDRLSKPQGRPLVRHEQVHDRRARELPENAAVRIVEVSDPYEAGATIAVIASLRDDPFGRMHNRGEFDEAHYAAGRHYQALCEAAEVSGVRAMDTTKEPVDGRGPTSFPFTDSQLRAMKELARVSSILRAKRGSDGECLVKAVLVDHFSIRQIIEASGVSASDLMRRMYRRDFRKCLEILAVALGYAQPSLNGY